MAAVTLQFLVERVVRDAAEAAVAFQLAVGHAARAKTKRTYRQKKLLPGFPISITCPGPDEAKAYFAEPQLTCLLCGKTYALLASHLLQTHDVSADEYRASYRLPWTAGLAGTDMLDAKSRALKERLADPKFANAWFADADRHRQEAQASRQREQPFRKELNRQRLQRASTGPWEEADFLRILEVMKDKDFVLKGVAGNLAGVPSYVVAVKWFNSTPSRRQLLTETVHQLSARNQAKAKMLSPGVVKQLKTLAAQGLLQREIADRMGLSVMTVAKYLRR